MQRYLMLRLEGPLMAFGDVMVDAIGPIRDAPSASALTGLLANALGMRREEAGRMQRLQDRLVFGSRIDRPGERFTEFQTAKLEASDKGWTTRGRPEGRAGGSATYDSPHIRYRDHDADKCVTVALRLDPAEEPPDLDALAAVLDEPARPLFLGRKPCLPSHRILLGFRDADNLYGALTAEPLAHHGDRPRRTLPERIAFFLPWDGAQGLEKTREVRVCDRRDWKAGIHSGEIRLALGSVDRAVFPAEQGTRP